MGANLDNYADVVATIQTSGISPVSVPRLSSLLGIKSTTLNARFRRQHIPLHTVGKVTFVPLELAFQLAELHKYALMGWPTLQQASQLTGVKSATIKARCEKGQIEGHIDLTKRLRVNPAALRALQSIGTRSPRAQSTNASITIPIRPRRRSLSFTELERGLYPADRSGPTTKPCELAPAEPPQIKIITAKDYGLSETTQKPVAVATRQRSGYLCYDPDRPLSLSECTVGKSIRYGEYYGTIVRVLADPFNPKIKVRFPDHRHPLMQEVLLVVEKQSR
jgi:hypothetical protein